VPLATLGGKYPLFRAKRTGQWLREDLLSRFGVHQDLDGASAQRMDDESDAKLRQGSFIPRALFERFEIDLEEAGEQVADFAHHLTMRACRPDVESAWKGAR